MSSGRDARQNAEGIRACGRVRAVDWQGAQLLDRLGLAAESSAHGFEENCDQRNSEANNRKAREEVVF